MTVFYFQNLLDLSIPSFLDAYLLGFSQNISFFKKVDIIISLEVLYIFKGMQLFSASFSVEPDPRAQVQRGAVNPYHAIGTELQTASFQTQSPKGSAPDYRNGYLILRLAKSS